MTFWGSQTNLIPFTTATTTCGGGSGPGGDLPQRPTCLLLMPQMPQNGKGKLGKLGETKRKLGHMTMNSCIWPKGLKRSLAAQMLKRSQGAATVSSGEGYD
eukprot:EG_transcript_33800